MKEKIRNEDLVLGTALRRLDRTNISEKNKRLILQFKQECFSLGLSKGRVAKYLHYLARLGEWLEMDFPDATKQDIKTLVLKIEGSHYVPFSKAEHKICVKKFYKWLRDSEDYPDEVRWIRPMMGQSRSVKMPEEILTQEEVKKLIEHAPTDRDNAFVATMYESGCRIGEILFLRLKHMEFDKYGVLMRVDGKTGPRRVRLIASVPYLKDWLNRHPFKGNPDARLWLTRTGDNLTYGGVTSLLRTIAKRAGIRKRVNPHSFRHARATHLANHLTEAQMKEYFGWAQGSYMASVYVHLSGRDVDNALLTKVYGIKPAQHEDKEDFKPVKCSKCGRDNPATFKFCGLCGIPLDEKVAIEVIQQEQERAKADTVMDRLMQDSEFRDLMLRKIQDFSNQTRTLRANKD